MNLIKKSLLAFALILTTSNILPWYGGYWGGYGPYGYPYAYGPYGYGGPAGFVGAFANTVATVEMANAISRNSDRRDRDRYRDDSDSAKAKTIKNARADLYDLEDELSDIRKKHGSDSKEYRHQKERIKDQQNYIAKLVR